MKREGLEVNFREVPIPEETISLVRHLKNEIAESDSILDVERLKVQLFDLLNTITDNKFSDNRNAIHVIRRPSNVNKFSIKDFFDLQKLADYGEFHGGRGFNFSFGNNIYVREKESDIILIFNPKNRNVGRLLNLYLSWVSKGKLPYDSSVHVIKNFLDGNIPDYFENQGYDWGKLVFGALEKLKLKIRWSQIADCIVNLDERKVYFFDK